MIIEFEKAKEITDGIPFQARATGKKIFFDVTIDISCEESENFILLSNNINDKKYCTLITLPSGKEILIAEKYNVVKQEILDCRNNLNK